MSVYGRWKDGVKMPSELADGKDSGMEAGPVITYQLSPEELAKYREEGKKMGGKPRVNVDALHARFAAGEGADWKDAGRVASEMGCATNSVLYHRGKWDAAKSKLQAAATAEPEPTPAPPAEAEPAPEFNAPDLGDIYEGRIVKVADRYALVRLIACGVQGKVGNREIRKGQPPADLRYILGEGDPVNVRVVGRWNGADGQDKWDLSIKQAPAHPDGPVIPEEEAPMQTAAVSGASLCATCVKRDVCPLLDMYSDPQELPAENKPGRLAHVQVVYGPRPVAECSAYVAEGSMREAGD